MELGSGLGLIMPTSPPPPHAEPVDMYEEIAAEFMLHEGEVVFRDQCDLLDEFTVADLADQLVAVWAERIGEVDFERLGSSPSAAIKCAASRV